MLLTCFAIFCIAPDFLVSCHRLWFYGRDRWWFMVLQGLVLSGFIGLVFLLPHSISLIAGCLYLLAATLNLGHFLVYRQPLDYFSASEILQSNVQEWWSFLLVCKRSSVYLPLAYLLSGLMIWGLMPAVDHSMPVVAGPVIAVLGCSAAIVYRPEQLKWMFPLNYLLIARWVVLEWKRARQLGAGIATPGRYNIESANPQVDKLVIVIGESMRSGNMSLYGYNRNTTPQLCALRDELLLFECAISPSSNTRHSLRYCLTPESPTGADERDFDLSLPAIAKRAGYRTCWISNQPRVSGAELTVLASQCDEEKNYFNKTTLGDPDRVVLPALQDALNKDGNAVIFVHLIGSHFRYELRSEPGFRQFPCSGRNYGHPRYRDELVDNYDNSILYCDMVLGSIIDICKQRVESVALACFSDHGEALFDDGVSFGHGLAMPVAEEFSVPYFYWFNETYRQLNPDALEVLQREKEGNPCNLRFFTNDVLRIMNWTVKGKDYSVTNLDNGHQNDARFDRVFSRGREISFSSLGAGS